MPAAETSLLLHLALQTILPPYVVCLLSHGNCSAFVASFLLVKGVAEAYKTSSRCKYGRRANGLQYQLRANLLLSRDSLHLKRLEDTSTNKKGMPFCAASGLQPTFFALLDITYASF